MQFSSTTSKHFSTAVSSDTRHANALPSFTQAGLGEGGATQSGFKLRGLWRPKASKRSLLMVARQLSLLVETGIDLAEALELSAASCKHSVLREALETIHEDITSGHSLSAAVNAQKYILGEQVAASIQAGEASGKLVDVLRQISTQLEEELQMRATITGALAYPAILASASIVVSSILIWFVLPQFENSFASMGVDPPTLTLALLGGAAFIRNYVLLLTLGTLVSAILLAMCISQPGTQRILYGMCFSSPVIGPALRNLSVGRLFVSLGHLLSNGISLLEAIQLVRASAGQGPVDQMTARWEDDVVAGKGLTHSLDEFGFLPDGADAMLIMAERTGKLESVLSTAGSFYRQEGTNRLQAVLKLSEPLIIITLGAFVGLVVASVLLPILDVQAAGGGR